MSVSTPCAVQIIEYIFEDILPKKSCSNAINILTGWPAILYSLQGTQTVQCASSTTKNLENDNEQEVASLTENLSHS